MLCLTKYLGLGLTEGWMIMGINFSSGLLAGVTAAVIWISICLLIGADMTTAGLWALIFLVIGTAGTTVIANAISKRKASQRT